MSFVLLQEYIRIPNTNISSNDIFFIIISLVFCVPKWYSLHFCKEYHSVVRTRSCLARIFNQSKVYYLIIRSCSMSPKLYSFPYFLSVCLSWSIPYGNLYLFARATQCIHYIVEILTFIAIYCTYWSGILNFLEVTTTPTDVHSLE